MFSFPILPYEIYYLILFIREREKLFAILCAIFIYKYFIFHVSTITRSTERYKIETFKILIYRLTNLPQNFQHTT